MNKSKSNTNFIDPDILKIGGNKIPRGRRKKIELKCASLYDGTELKMSVEVIRGSSPGPVLFVSAAIHGDELNGVEIVRRLSLKKLKINGTLILIPIVNMFGFNFKSRYLPDRRDLNRCFPGSQKGSLAGQLASLFMREIVAKCSHGIDLHTGSNHRTNLPHIRACLDDPETYELAEGFGSPVIINSNLRDGSLREAARKKNVKMLLFEGGEALRFEERIIASGLKGCLSVMNNIGMIKGTQYRAKKHKVFTAAGSYWIRAPKSGVALFLKKVGDKVLEDEVIARVSNPSGAEEIEITADEGGIIVGSGLLPLVNRGDAIYHIATFSRPSKVSQAVLAYEDILDQTK